MTGPATMVRPSHILMSMAAAYVGVTHGAVRDRIVGGMIIPIVFQGRKMVAIDALDAWRDERKARLERELAAATK